MIFQSLNFLALLAGLLSFVVRFYLPSFPLDETQILSLILFALGLIGIVPMYRHGLASIPVIFNKIEFWQLVVAVAGFTARYYAPDFPFTDEVLLAGLIFVLGWFKINPELRSRGLLANAPKKAAKK
jgi:hypothetical protein